MPDTSKLKQQIVSLFADHLFIEIPATDADLIDGGLLDSMMLVDLLAQLESEFKISIAMNDLDLSNFRSVDKMSEYVAGMLGSQSSSNAGAADVSSNESASSQ